MRLQGWVKRQLVSVLIDSGSTHNFINGKLARLLDWPTQQSASFEVLVVDGNKLECLAKCIDLEIDIQGHKFSADMYLLPLKGSYVVLGVIWDFKNLTMDFTMDDRHHHIQGQSRVVITPASINGAHIAATAKKNTFSTHISAYCDKNCLHELDDSHSLIPLVSAKKNTFSYESRKAFME